MKIPRLRMLRHWSMPSGARGCWLWMIEPRWPFVIIERFELEDDLQTLIIPLKETHSLDIIVEHFAENGDCELPIWSVSLSDHWFWRIVLKLPHKKSSGRFIK